MTLDPELKKQFKRIRKNQQRLAWIMFLVFVGLIIVLTLNPASAQTITITNSAGSSLRDINVYYPNATTGQMDLLGRYNTTSIITTDGDTSYTFDLVPMESNPLTDPTDWMNNQALPYINTNITALVALCFLIGLAFYGYRSR